MTDNEIIKALECCFTDNFGDCEECPLKCKRDDIFSCMRTKQEATLDLINRQKAEIERLKAEKQSIKYCYEQAKSYNDTLAESCEKNCKKFNMTTRAEAIKEFAERVKEQTFHYYDYDIDNLVKEITEQKNIKE